MAKFMRMTDELYDYVLEQHSERDPLLEELVGRIRNLRITQEPVYEPNIFVKAVVSVGIGFDLR